MRVKIFSLTFSLVFFILGLSSVSFAVQAAPDIIEVVQPDGHVFKATIQGDEWNNRTETADGYSVKRGRDRFWNYIERYDKSVPVLSNRRAHSAPRKGLKKHIRPDKKFMRVPPGISRRDALQSAPSGSGAIQSGPAGAPAAPSGPFNGPILFILVEFSDHQGTYSEASFASFITDNITDYFDKASYGNVTLSPASESFGAADNGVIGWINLGTPHPNTGGSTDNRNRQLTRDAILAANAYIDYSSYDLNGDNYVDADELAVVVIAAGFERAYNTSTPNVWGHKWSLGWGGISSPVVDGVRVADYHSGAGGYAQFGEKHGLHQATMGIMVHELGHLMFGLPDLYDTDGSSRGIGAFGVMASGSWGKAASESFSGQTPVLPSAWSKLDLGWISGFVASDITSLIAAGSASATSDDAAYMLPTSLSNEYFLVENRQPLGYDRGLERWLGTSFGGLAIWHIDENTIANKLGNNSVNTYECYPGGPSCTSDHYGVALVQADGSWHLEKDDNRGNKTDLWYSGNKTDFGALSLPDSNLYSGSPSSVSITGIGPSGDPMIAAFDSYSFKLTLVKAGSGDGTVTSSPVGIDCGQDCDENYIDNTVVTLVQIPSVDSTFGGWSGDIDCEDGVVTMNTDVTCTATYDMPQYELTTNVSPPDSGTINPCSGVCWYDSETIVILTATENIDYEFTDWTGCDSPVNNICNMTMDSNKAVTANFGLCQPLFRIAGTTPVYYSHLQDAYDAAALFGDTIQSRNVIYSGDLYANRPISVILEGGYNCDYSDVDGVTTLNGNMEVSDGLVEIADFIFGN